MRLKVQPRFQRDRNGRRARVGDSVWFHLDPEKPHKRPSKGTIVRWISASLVEIRYTGTGYDGTNGPHYFDLGSHEFVVAVSGPIARRVRSGTRISMPSTRARESEANT